MPIYEFFCGECEKKTELLMGLREKTPACPHCQKDALKKLVSRSSFVLKGTGWYESDFKKTGKAGNKEKGNCKS